MYISYFSFNILHIISLLVDIDCFHHSSMKIVHVHTSFYGFILNRKILGIPTSKWIILLLHCLRHILVGQVCYILWITTCFITSKNPGKLSQLVVICTERVCWLISSLYEKLKGTHYWHKTPISS